MTSTINVDLWSQNLQTSSSVEKWVFRRKRTPVVTVLWSAIPVSKYVVVSDAWHLCRVVLHSPSDVWSLERLLPLLPPHNRKAKQSKRRILNLALDRHEECGSSAGGFNASRFWLSELWSLHCTSLTFSTVLHPKLEDTESKPQTPFFFFLASSSQNKRSVLRVFLPYRLLQTFFTIFDLINHQHIP